MTVYLSMALSANRKGRFLQNVAAAMPMSGDWRSDPLLAGLLLVQADELQTQTDWQQLYDWSMLPGCAALVVNPQPHLLAGLAKLANPLDWQLAPVVSANGSDELTALLAAELDAVLCGAAGSADRNRHLCGDNSHTRYVRKHSNSGVFAVSTLPLWSLTLLDHQTELVAWLQWFLEHAGVAAEQPHQPSRSDTFVPDRHDQLVLLITHAAAGIPLNILLESRVLQAMFDIRQLDLVNRAAVLAEHGYIANHGLTELGQASLEASAYLAYAPLLAKELTIGAR